MSREVSAMVGDGSEPDGMSAARVPVDRPPGCGLSELSISRKRFGAWRSRRRRMSCEGLGHRLADLWQHCVVIRLELRASLVAPGLVGGLDSALVGSLGDVSELSISRKRFSLARGVVTGCWDRAGIADFWKRPSAWWEVLPQRR